jgi:hypothetical protein
MTRSMLAAASLIGKLLLGEIPLWVPALTSAFNNSKVRHAFLRSTQQMNWVYDRSAILRDPPRGGAAIIASRRAPSTEAVALVI